MSSGNQACVAAGVLPNSSTARVHLVARIEQLSVDSRQQSQCISMCISVGYDKDHNPGAHSLCERGFVVALHASLPRLH